MIKSSCSTVDIKDNIAVKNLKFVVLSELLFTKFLSRYNGFSKFLYFSSPNEIAFKNHGRQLKVNDFTFENIEKIFIILARLHNLNIVHGDICPTNMLINDEGKITLIDFGCSTYLGNNSSIKCYKVLYKQIYRPSDVPDKHDVEWVLTTQHDLITLANIFKHIDFQKKDLLLDMHKMSAVDLLNKYFNVKEIKMPIDNFGEQIKKIRLTKKYYQDVIDKCMGFKNKNPVSYEPSEIVEILNKFIK